MDHMHENHRQRMKARYLAEGMDSFSRHNVLEFLLFYAIPRKDTNDIAHALINHFGSLSGVLEASVEELMAVKGISEHSAILIHSILPIMRHYNRDKFAQASAPCDTFEKLANYARSQFIGAKRERVKVVLFNDSMQIIGCEALPDGIPGQVAVDARLILEMAVRYGAASIALLHNHLGPYALPSREDYECGYRIKTVCESISVRLVAHLIVADEAVVSLLGDKNFCG